MGSLFIYLWAFPALLLLFGVFFIINQQTAGVIERFGKFSYQSCILFLILGSEERISARLLNDEIKANLCLAVTSQHQKRSKGNVGSRETRDVNSEFDSRVSVRPSNIGFGINLRETMTGSKDEIFISIVSLSLAGRLSWIRFLYSRPAIIYQISKRPSFCES